MLKEIFWSKGEADREVNIQVIQYSQEEEKKSAGLLIEEGKGPDAVDDLLPGIN